MSNLVLQMLNGKRSIYQLINLIDLIISFEMCSVKLFLDPVLTCAILHSYLQIESDIDTIHSNKPFNQPIFGCAKLLGRFFIFAWQI